MEVTKVTIQQLLRPTETCKFIVKGQHLDIQSHDDHVLAVVHHEGSTEHALFVFSVDNLGSLVVNNLIPIKGSFATSVQSNTLGGCNACVNTADGEIIMFRLPYDTNTAKLFNHLKVAHNYYISSPSVNSPSSFEWLRGYEGCRTGWDRFSKPRSNTVPGYDYKDGLPDNWPWGYIITPNPEGSTEVAMCESLIDEFDPLRNSSRSPPSIDPATTNIKRSRPVSNAKLQDSTLFKQQPGNSLLTPETTTIRASHSDSNISALGRQGPTLIPGEVSNMHSTKSHLALTSKRMGLVESSFEFSTSDMGSSPHHLTPSPNHVTPSPNHVTPSPPRLVTPSPPPYDQHLRLQCRPQGLESSDSSMDNPFLEDKKEESHLDAMDKTRFWLNEDDADIEMRKVDDQVSREQHRTRLNDGSMMKKNTSKGAMGKRTASLDVLNERSDSTVSSLDRVEGERGRDVAQLDYTFRRIKRANDSTPSLLTQSFDHSIDTPPVMLPTRSKTSTVQMSNVMSKSPKFFKRKSPRSANTSPTPKSTWVTRYQPGMLLLKGSMRECLIQRMLHEREEDFCEYTKLKLFCGTWNVNGQQAMQRMDKWLLCDKETPDIFAIGFQELDLSKEALLTKDSGREEMWIDLVESSLRMAGKFKRISSQRLVGILLLVYVEQSLVEYVSDVEADSVPCGIMGHLGNKGGVAVRFNIHHSSICIINSHLAAHVEEVEKRNQDYHQIYNRLQFFKNTELPYSITEHNIVVWMGDLNYRLQCPPSLTVEDIKAYADHFQLHKLLPLDQLHMQQKSGQAFTQFHEGRIDFKPTYKYDPSTNTWDTSEKNRAPAWCDRVLYYSQDDLLEIIEYTSHPEMIISDHKPVSCVFNAKVKVVMPDKEKDVLEQITRKLDKQENETLPQVELNLLEFKFNNVKFMVRQSQVLKVRNVGQRPVQISFVSTPDKGDAISKPWLTVKPDRAIILKDEEVKIRLTMMVDHDIAPSLHSKNEKLEDILVLHLEGGKDFFLSVTGNYLMSCFGSKLETLVHIHKNIREVPTGDLLDLSSSWEEYDKNGLQERTSNSPPPLDIPKELYRLVYHLTEKGLTTENLFTDGGLTNEQEKIRDCLDTGEMPLVGGVFSVAATLLLFLRSLAEPVVPRDLHQKCMDGCNNIVLCKQILMQMSTVHRRTFVFLVTFLKQVLQHSHENQIDAKLLASIFGEVLLNTSREVRQSQTRKSLAHMNKKKATFLWQFLVNDLTVDYK